MIKTPELYDYIRLNNIEKVEEYLIQLNEDEANKLTLEKLQNLLAYSIDWKRLDIIKLFIQYSGNPKMINNFAMWYATQNTNNIPDLAIIAYLSEAQTLCQYIGNCGCETKPCNCNV